MNTQPNTPQSLCFSRKCRRNVIKLKDTIFTKGKQNFIIVAALIVLTVIFTFLNSNFLSQYNIISMMQSLAPYAIMALGVTFVIATGGIDLSLGTVCIAAAVVSGKCYMSGMPLWLTIPMMIAIGTLFGFINGVLVAKLKLPQFIATLGTMMLARGLSAIIVSTPNIFFPNGVWFNSVFSNADGIPTGLFWVLGLWILCMYLMYKCKIGRYILAIGSNEEAARLSGVKTDKYKIIAYTFSGMGAGIAAIFWAASFATVATATGNGMEMDAIAGVYIGGTSAAGGVASISGSIIGSLILVVIRSGLNFVLAKFQINLNSTYVTYVLTGIIVVLAVLMDVIKNKNASKVKPLTDKGQIKKKCADRIEALQCELDIIISDKSTEAKERENQIKRVREEIKECKLSTKAELAKVKHN